MIAKWQLTRKYTKVQIVNNLGAIQIVAYAKFVNLGNQTYKL